MIDIEAMIALIETDIDVLVESLRGGRTAGARGFQRETMASPHGGRLATLKDVEIIRGRRYVHSSRDVGFTGTGW